MKHLDTFKQKYLNDELLKYSSNKSALQHINNLIYQGADVNCKNNFGDTPLMIACYNTIYKAVSLYIERGADVNLVNGYNQNALSKIATVYMTYFSTNSQKIVDLLIESGIDLNVITKFRNTKEETAFDISPKIENYVKEKYPEKYEEYLMKKNVMKYNI